MRRLKATMAGDVASVVRGNRVTDLTAKARRAIAKRNPPSIFSKRRVTPSANRPTCWHRQPLGAGSRSRQAARCYRDAGDPANASPPRCRRRQRPRSIVARMERSEIRDSFCAGRHPRISPSRVKDAPWLHPATSYRIVIASPLRSALICSPRWTPVSRSVVPFPLTSASACAPRPTAPPTPPAP